MIYDIIAKYGVKVMSEKKYKTDGEKREISRALAIYSQVAITIVACVAIGLFIGVILDRLFNTNPILTIIFIVLGILSAIKSIFDINKKINR